MIIITPLDDSDDYYKIIGTSAGSGSPSSYVNALAIDKDGEIWIDRQRASCFYSSYSIMNELNYDIGILIEKMEVCSIFWRMK